MHIGHFAAQRPAGVALQSVRVVGSVTVVVTSAVLAATISSGNETTVRLFGQPRLEAARSRKCPAIHGWVIVPQFSEVVSGTKERFEPRTLLLFLRELDSFVDA
jgi:hypothetical protein